MSLLDAVKQSGLDSVIRIIGSHTLVTDVNNGRLHIYFSNGDTVLVTDLGDKEIDELQAKLGLNNRQGVLNLIVAALKELQPPSLSSDAAAAAALSIPLARGSQREAPLRLQPPGAAQAPDARRRLFALVSARAANLSLELDSTRRALESARSSGGDAAAMLGKRLGGLAGAGAGPGKKVARTALPGMSLVNPMQRKRRAARGVVFDDDDDDDEQEKEEVGEESDGDDGGAVMTKGRKK